MATHTHVTDPEEGEVINRDRGHEGPIHVNDDLDDIFGSAPVSPTLSNDAPNDENLFYGKEKARGNAEVSDIPRLKEKHETEGYRDGVTNGKAESVQKGFDEGYGLGATLGLRIGKVLGLLEGIYNAVVSTTKDPVNVEDKGWQAEKERLERLFEDAKEELKTQNFFGKEWWSEDGTWRFEVPGEREGKEVTFADVASSHPLVGKWEEVIRGEVERWGLDLGVLEKEKEIDENDVEQSEKKVEKGQKEVEKRGKEEETPVSRPPGAAKELSW